MLLSRSIHMLMRIYSPTETSVNAYMMKSWHALPISLPLPRSSQPSAIPHASVYSTSSMAAKSASAISSMSLARASRKSRVTSPICAAPASSAHAAKASGCIIASRYPPFPKPPRSSSPRFPLSAPTALFKPTAPASAKPVAPPAAWSPSAARPCPSRQQGNVERVVPRPQILAVAERHARRKHPQLYLPAHIRKPFA